MAEIKQRTLIAEYIIDGERKPPGTVVDLSAVAFRKAIGAGVVYEDDERNAEVAVRDETADAAVPENDATGARADETSDADLARAQTGAKAAGASPRSRRSAAAGRQPRARK